MDRPLVAVVLAGGTGRRLYPASTPERPKQFRSFGGERSLLARTVDRLAFADEVVVLTGEAHVDLVRDHAPGATILVEPAARDTGPALVYAAALLGERLPDPVLLCCPSDHHVAGDFEALARRAAAVAADGEDLVTMGVEPTRPDTGYGYVRPGPFEDGVAPVREFVEKPDRERAATLVQEGWLWNAGIFAWTPGALLSAATGTPLSGLADAADCGGLDDAFRAVPSVSIDHAVLEGASHRAVVRAGFEWDDLGSWDALGRLESADEEGTVRLGDTVAIDATDSVVVGDGAHVSVVGVDDLVVVAVGDRVLVVPREQSQRVREVVAALEEQGEL